MAKIGAFELSMSFIITIVFAVVMLTLALTWLSGYFEDINDMSSGLFQEGQNKIKNIFSEGDDNFFIWPESQTVTLAKQTKIAFAAGLKNDADDGENHKFVLNVYATEVPNGMTKSQVNNWVDFSPTSKTINIGSYDDSKKIVINIPNNAKKGNYFFEVAACWDAGGAEPKSSSCNADSDNLWGATSLEFLLTVE